MGWTVSVFTIVVFGGAIVAMVVGLTVLRHRPDPLAEPMAVTMFAVIGQQRLDDDLDIYTVIDRELPGAWRNRMDRIWHNTETDELVVIRSGTMAQVGDGDGYQVNIHRTGGVDTVLDNVSLDRANEAVALYIRRGAYPEESWLSDVQGGDGG